MKLLPRIISVDDHVVEPSMVWTDRLPAEYHDIGPRVRRLRGRQVFEAGVHHVVEDDGPESGPIDVWFYERSDQAHDSRLKLRWVRR